MNKLAEFPLERAGFAGATDDTVIVSWPGWSLTVGDVRTAAASQPEQTSIKTWMHRLGPDYNDSKEPTAHEIAMEAEIIDLRAALAIPASMAPAQQENEQSKVCTPIWQKREGNFGETVIRCATCGTFKGRPCRLPASTAASECCPHCDGTGDVTRMDGEWLGHCTCGAGAAASEQPSRPDYNKMVLAELERVCPAQQGSTSE